MADLCITLFYMGHIHLQNEEVVEAVQAWLTVYGIAKKMNLAQALQALESLAGHIGLEGGLQGWEMLAQEYEKTGVITLPIKQQRKQSFFGKIASLFGR